MIFDQNDLNFVNFFPVPKTSFARIKYHHKGEIKDYDHLIQVVIKMKSIVFHIDAEKGKLVEVAFLDNF